LNPAPTPPDPDSNLSPSPSLEPGQVIFETVKELMAVGDGTRVRGGPGTGYGVVTMLSRGERVETGEMMHDWYKVTVSPDLEGYIRSDLLVPYVENADIITFDQPRQLAALGNGARVRSGPGGEYATVTSLTYGQRVETDVQVNNWYKVTVFPGLQEGYIISGDLFPYDENAQYFASDVIETINGLESHLVDVRRYMPDMEFYMILATTDCFTGDPLYSRDTCMLQKETLTKLQTAQEAFKSDGYTIKVYDAYRPSSVSGAMYSLIRDSRYVAPAGSSAHNRGAAVDISLVDVATGRELEMPSPMHTFNETSHRNYSGMTETAKANMDYMAEIMLQCGFETVNTEWWHFQEPNRYVFPVLDYPISSFNYE
jgi:D-alanyl-D-alanine dipeptidase